MIMFALHQADFDHVLNLFDRNRCLSFGRMHDFCHPVGDQPDVVADALCERLVGGLWVRFVATLTDAPTTLVHGDAHVGNTYVLPGDGLGFLDWQVLRRGRGVVDLGYFLQGAVTVDHRRAHETELIDSYLDALELPSAERPSRRDLWRWYRASAVHGLALWLATFSYGAWQRPEVSLALVQRYAAAFVDLESTDAIEATA